MSKMIVYFDGSQIERNQTYAHGYGVVAEFNGQTVELYGVEKSKDARRKGMHELFAFYHAMQYAESQGFVPSEVSLYNDYDNLCYSAFYLHRENRRGVTREKLVANLRKFRDTFVPGDRFAVLRMLRWMMGARWHWVKGHNNCVRNMRADYLAGVASREKGSLMDYDNWLHQGFAFWDSAANEQSVYYPPFTKTLNENNDLQAA